ncbi:lipase secretion chaperone [Piscinibacter sp. HJYY11]|uniref:lipase secretion chaperone n=1 Tax=Piscinibacter sp. HJYY11 TaxID=2801333 RepID=UPI001F38B42B|nr:lipase secretion chaperone [Piscinibacter sp. HJYY11]
MVKRALLLLMLTTALAACAAPPPTPRSVDEVRATGSLRGTELDGAWAAPGKRREAEALLLRRFDHLLTALGETSLPELRRFIEREVTREHGPQAAHEALAAWDDHLAVLQGRPPTQMPDGPAPEPTPRVPKRPAVVPRSLLAPDKPVNEADAQALHAQRVAQLGAAAAERLRAQDLSRWDWQRRIDDARSALQSLAPAAKDAELARRFTGRELPRARALLGLPPA